MRKIQFVSNFFILFLIVLSCQTPKRMQRSFLRDNLSLISSQYNLQTDLIEQSGKVIYPKTYINGQIRYVLKKDWTSGFFPGSVWYLYELTGDEKWKTLAVKYTESLDSIKKFTASHDVGFMICSSFGNGLRLLGTESYKDVIIRAAESLSMRFRPNAGVIKSWDVDRGWQSERGWECPVIIDNMMNLELLFKATELSGDSSFYNIAVTHANSTIKNHFRPDYSTWHVVDYNLRNGTVRSKQTAQGFAHHTTWARGQAWAIYGFVMCFRETGDPRYLEQAEKAFEYVIGHINFPADCIPYWDFEAPNIPFANRDASAAAIIASALYEMATYTKTDYYKSWADRIMENLSGPFYRAEAGKNGYFILQHSVGSIPHGVEIDVPLVYADYYFLEALKRKRDIETVKRK